MAVAIGAVTSGPGTGTAARTMTYPTVAATDVVVCIIDWGINTVTLTTPPAGFTPVPNLPATASSNIWAGVRIGPGGGTSYTPSASTRDTWTIVTLPGGHQTSPVNASGSAVSAAVAAAGTKAAPSVTTTTDGCAILSVAALYATSTGVGTTWTDPASTTRQAAPVSNTAGAVRWISSDLVTDTVNQAAFGATTARTFTTSVAGDMATLTIAIAPAPAPPPSPLQAPALIRPYADVALGGWTVTGAATAWDALDEVTADDNSSYITAPYPTPIGTISAECEVLLQPVTDPQRSDAHALVIRVSSSFNMRVRARLYQGGTTLIATVLVPTGGTWTTTTYTLTSAEADAITDYTDLRLRFANDNTTGTLASASTVTQAYLDVPGPMGASASTPFRRAGKRTY